MMNQFCQKTDKYIYQNEICNSNKRIVLGGGGRWVGGGGVGNIPTTSIQLTVAGSINLQKSNHCVEDSDSALDQQGDGYKRPGFQTQNCTILRDDAGTLSPGNTDIYTLNMSINVKVMPKCLFFSQEMFHVFACPQEVSRKKHPENPYI